MATLDEVRRRDVRGDEETVLRGVPCEIETGESRVVVTSEADVDVRPGDILEAEELERDMIVKGVRRRRSSEGFVTEILYREPRGGDGEG